VTVGVVSQPAADAERYRCAYLHCTQGLAGRGDRYQCGLDWGRSSMFDVKLDTQTENLADAGVMHVRAGLEHVASLRPRPDHERVHWSLYVLPALVHASGHAPGTTL